MANNEGTVSFTPEEAEIKMVLTTPFCPYGPMLTNQIQSVSEQAAEMPVKVTLAFTSRDVVYDGV